MIQRLTLSALLLLPALALGQTEAVEEPGTSPPEETVEENAAATTEDSGGPASPPSTAGNEDEISPFDYRASEQISEDLSVSFPVDI